MRPLKLSMSAFGPFPQTEQIDFAQLGENPLFLINGPTGSGKTTILDAICFALYGKTTGDERAGSQMRCDLALPETLTEIILQFELAGRRYRIRRLPEQQRPKSRGEGTTSQSPEAQLYRLLDDGSEKLLVSSKVTEATKYIEELTGLSVEQFRQVMVLPQGKFRQLLLAESAEREKIFSQLFQTRIYKRLEDSLKERSAVIRRQREDLKQIQQGILQAADLETVEALDLERQQLAPEVVQAEQLKAQQEQAATVAGQVLQQARALQAEFSRYEQTEVELSQLQQQQVQIDADRQRLQQGELALKLQPVFVERNRCQAALDQGQRDCVTRKQQQDRCAKQLLAADAELQGVTTVQQELDLAKQHASELSAYRSRVEQLAAARSRLETLQGEVQVAELQLEYQQLAGQYAQRCALDKLETDLVQQQNLLQREKQLGVRLRVGYEKAEQQAKIIELSWHQGQAAVLAAALNVGEPCPVCGSEQHPNLAVSAEELPTQQQLEQARDSAQRANQRLSAAREGYAAEKQKLNSLQQQLDRLRIDLADIVARSSAEFTSALSELSSRAAEQGVVLPALRQIQAADSDRLRAQSETKKSAAAAAEAQVQSAEQELPEAYRLSGALDRADLAVRKQIEQFEAQLKRVAENHQHAHGRAEAANAAAQAISEQLQKQQQALQLAAAACLSAIETSLFASEQDYLAALLPQQTSAAVRKQLADYDAECQRLAGALQQQRTALQGKQLADLEQLGLQLKHAEDEKLAAVNHWQQLDKRLSLLNGTWQKLSKAGEQMAELDQQYAVIGTLSDVANGQTGNKISLQRFVLSVLLDDVLIEASRRLSLMSKGRYQLLRKEDRSKGNKASGLELEVEDAYTGKLRSVATLSGGESFLAALSLALGLSDVVQAYAGGIRLDTLFIDEGFGSLDPESLDLAIRTLIDLQAAGRMIGIISHVAELKEQLPLRIDLLTDQLGSHTRLVSA